MKDNLTLLAEATVECFPCGGTGSIPLIRGLKTQPWGQNPRESYVLPSPAETVYLLMKFAMVQKLKIEFVASKGFVECTIEGPGKDKKSVGQAYGEMDAFTAALVELLGLRKGAKEEGP